MAETFFDEVLNDAKAFEQKVLGPDYPYYKYIATPAEMGMGTEGSLSQTATNVSGLINYIQMMITGTGPGNKGPLGEGQPLGDKFFLKTGGQCMDNETSKLVDRYIYINNVPDGSIPFISSGAGIQFTDFEGLIPGIMENLGNMNPIAIFKGFLEGNNPPCSLLTMPTIAQPPGDSPGARGSGSFHVADDDIKTIPPCDFPNKTNPKTGVGCTAAFTTLNQWARQQNQLKKPLVPVSAYPSEEGYNNFYILLCGLLMLFIVQKLLKKN